MAALVKCDGPLTLQPATLSPSRPGCIWLAPCVVPCFGARLETESQISTNRQQAVLLRSPNSILIEALPADSLVSGPYWSKAAPEVVFCPQKLFFSFRVKAVRFVLLHTPRLSSAGPYTRDYDKEGKYMPLTR